MILNGDEIYKYPIIISIICGESMFPIFRDGDLIVARRCNTFQKGDVVILREPMTNFLIIHRIIQNDPQRITTKGDANLCQDPNPVKSDKILGKVCVRIPKIGMLIQIIPRMRRRLCQR